MEEAMKKKQILVFLSLLLLLTGCKQDVGHNKTKENANAPVIKQNKEKVEVQEGGTLHLAMRTVQTLNPLLNEEETVDRILKLVYLPLVKLDEKRKPSPSIAKGWSFSEDGKTLSMTLREDIQWQDGTNLTADDVIFSMNTLRGASENAVYKNSMGYIASYTKTGTHSVTITFRQTFSGNLYALCFPVICAHYYNQENVLTSAKNMKPMGDGYYKFQEFIPTKELRLVKSETVFGEKAKMDNIVVSISADKNTDIFSFDQGLIDTLAADVTEMGKYDGTKNTKLFEYTTNYLDFIGFNFNQSLFQDKNIRKAISYALPREAILESVYLNHATMANTLVNPTSWLFEENTIKYTYKAEEAEKLLRASNWIDSNRDGIRDRKTNELVETLKITILVNAENEARRQIAMRLADELHALGFDVSIDVEAFESYTQKLLDKDYDMFIGGWQLSIIPDYSFMLHSSQIGNGNYAAYNSVEMNEILGAAYVAVKEEDIRNAYSKLQKYTAEELPYIGIAFRNSALFSEERVYGNVNPLENNIFDNINEWFLYDSPGK